jgi:alkaline phosphatase D
MPDGPDKTIQGKEQMAWFKKSFADSDATFRLLISPTPVVGPDRKSKHDNHANDDFEYEGNKLQDFPSSQKNAFVVCGDRHWQYQSVDSRTGLKEFSCGPASNKHAGGLRQKDFRKDMHRHLNITEDSCRERSKGVSRELLH